MVNKNFVDAMREGERLYAESQDAEADVLEQRAETAESERDDLAAALRFWRDKYYRIWNGTISEDVLRDKFYAFIGVQTEVRRKKFDRIIARTTNADS